MASVELERVTKTFGKTEVIRDVSLNIKDRELVVFVGPSGCGKSTLLRLIAGLEEITSGTLRIGNSVVNEIPAADRGIAMVFQSYALYPHMTVEENMGFALKMLGTDRTEIKHKVLEAADILHLDDLLTRMPKQLSGGQRQRVAIGRAIVRKPQVFLFDEPLSNLDAALRINTRVEIAKLHKMLKATIVYVTHDQVEAMTLADKIVVMNKGRIEQTGKPLDLYYKPANLFVAGFIGSPAMNFLSATVKKGGALTLADGQELKVKLPASCKSGDAVTLGCRPEHMTLDSSSALKLKGTIDIIERLGESGFAHVRLPAGQTIIAEVRGDPGTSSGKATSVSLDAGHIHIFDTQGQRLD